LQFAVIQKKTVGWEGVKLPGAAGDCTHLFLRRTTGADLQTAAGEGEWAVLGVQTLFNRNFGLIGLVYLQIGALEV
jgi:hypothetical protein